MPEKPVAGIDVSKDFSDMCIITPDNKVFQTVHIFHDATSLRRSLAALEAAAREFREKPVIVMESTAHYHRVIAQFLQSAGYEVMVINPMQSGALKNINIRKVKSDKSDAHRLALLYRLKTLHTTNQPNELLSNIRDYCRQRADIMNSHTAYVNRLTSLLDQAFPGYARVFSRVACKSSLGILKTYPSPAAILAADPEQLAETISKYARRGVTTDYVIKKVAALRRVAENAEEINLKREAYSVLIVTVAELLEGLQRHIETLKKRIIELATEDPSVKFEVSLLQTIPGIGLYSAVLLRAEIGDFSLFQKPKQLVAFFGMDPSTRQSGKFVGTKTKISKRGSPYARAILDICAQSAVHPVKGKEPANPVLANYYAEKVKTKEPKVVKCIIMRKLVNIIFAVLRDKKPFELRTPEEHTELLKHPNISRAA